jgi:hypothetical protein
MCCNSCAANLRSWLSPISLSTSFATSMM